MKRYRTALVAAGLALHLATVYADVRYLGEGHTDLALDYSPSDKTWNVHVGSDSKGSEFTPDEVVLKVKPPAQTTVPADSKFAFLGTPGDTIWILPQAQNEDILYLGYGGDGIPSGVFIGDQVKVGLVSVTGPGDFFSYRVDGFGNPQVLFNTKDGISTNDVATVQSGGDAHLNWAFSQPGEYKVILNVSGTLVESNAPSSSGPVTFTFNVGGGPKILDSGHTDLSLDYFADEDVWDVHVGSDSLAEGYDADDLILQVKAEAKTTVPSDSKFAFLGDAGSPIWILPQAQNEDILYLGYGGDGIPAGVFVNDQVNVTLTSVTGPGDFFSYRVDGFGNPQVLFNTHDGISATDSVTVQSGGDAHLNWAFTQAGNYAVTIEVSAVLIDGNRSVSSGPVTYSFSVLQPVVELPNEHVDLRVLYNAEASPKLSIVARDETHLINYLTNETLLVVREAARLTLPAGTPFGNEGDAVWIIPQSQDTNLLYLGISAEGISDGIFTGNLRLNLIAVDGPGQFFIWQASSFGDFNIKMDTRDGISDADKTTPLIGSHEHYNWGFTTNGIYHVTLQVSGQPTGGSTSISSGLTTFTFYVLPLPVTVATIELQQTSLTSGNLAFNIAGLNGGTVDIEATVDFVTWTTVSTVTITNSPQAVTIPMDSTKPTRFFRAHQK
jgi:surface-anchored protein